MHINHTRKINSMQCGAGVGVLYKVIKENIIGIAIRIGRLQGKFKTRQKYGVKSKGGRAGVTKGFGGLGANVGAREVKDRRD